MANLPATRAPAAKRQSATRARLLHPMRLTIGKKLGLAITVIVILCVGTMGWVISQNLQRGFVSYLNQIQGQNLEQLAKLLEKRYEEQGGFDWLRHNRREMRLLLDQLQPATVSGLPADPRSQRRGRPAPPADRPGWQGDLNPDNRFASDLPATHSGYGVPDNGPPARRADGPPDRGLNGGPEDRPDPLANGRPDGRPEPERRPDQRPDGAPDADPNRALNGQRPPPLEADPPPRADPMGFAGRISIIGADGRPVVGPKFVTGAIERPLRVRGETIGILRLAPIESIGNTTDGALALQFISSQIHTILVLALVLIGLSILLAALLARHMLRPVRALREVTGQIAHGRFEARAPVLNQDEISELAHDVNDMAQALQENEQRRRKMLADISHELRTPLSVIRGEIEALQDGVRPTGPAALQSLHGEILRLNKLVDDLHQLSLADSGHLHCKHQEIDLVPLLSGIVERYQPRADSAHLQLKGLLPPTPVMLKADPDRLTQVFTNLLENSLRYTDAGGTVALSLRTNSKRVQILVEDSAPGVASEALPRLFERLYRTDAARNRTSGGSGLGLAICQALVHAHGGMISAHASPLGGVKIQIQLPRLVS